MAKMSTDDLLDAFKEMTLLELSEFVKKFEEVFEVTAAAPVAVAAATILADRPGTTRMAVVAAVVAVLLVGLRWRMLRAARMPGDEATALAVDDAMAG